MIRRLDKKHDGNDAGSTCYGHVRVVVVGDSGVGKSSIVHLIVQSVPILNPRRTVGCSIEVKHVTCGGTGTYSNGGIVSRQSDFFVELWDLSGHERYKECRSIFYSELNGVIFVHDLTQRKTKSSLQKWATELAAHATFSAPMSMCNAAGIPVPFLVIGNKADIAPKNGGSSGNLVDVARHWVEKQGFLPSGDELPITESFPGNGGLVAASWQSATESRLDLEAMTKFFRSLIWRQYFTDESANPSSLWASPPRSLNVYDPRGASLHEDDYNSDFISTRDESGCYNAPVAAQTTLLPPPFPYPQQPLAVAELHPVSRSISRTSSWTSSSGF